VKVVPLEFSATVVAGQPATVEQDGFAGYLFGLAAREDGTSGSLVVQRADEPRPEWEPYCLVWGELEGTTYGGVTQVEVHDGEVIFELSRYHAAELGTPAVFRISFPAPSTEAVRAGLRRTLGAGVVR
jgi:hypothetical protein